jgi:hypothetical protein
MYKAMQINNAGLLMFGFTENIYINAAAAQERSFRKIPAYALRRNEYAEGAFRLLLKRCMETTVIRYINRLPPLKTCQSTPCACKKFLKIKIMPPVKRKTITRG